MLFTSFTIFGLGKKNSPNFPFHNVGRSGSQQHSAYPGFTVGLYLTAPSAAFARTYSASNQLPLEKPCT